MINYIKNLIHSLTQSNTPTALTYLLVFLGGLGVTCSPRDPRFAGSNPAEVDGFLQDIKILSTSPTGGTLSWGPESEISGSLNNLKLEKTGL